MYGKEDTMYIQDNRKMLFRTADIGYHFEYNDNYYIKVNEKCAVSLSERAVRPFCDELITGFDDSMHFEGKKKVNFAKIPIGEFFSTYNLFLKIDDDKGFVLETCETEIFDPETEVCEVETEMFVES